MRKSATRERVSLDLVGDVPISSDTVTLSSLFYGCSGGANPLLKHFPQSKNQTKIVHISLLTVVQSLWQINQKCKMLVWGLCCSPKKSNWTANFKSWSLKNSGKEQFKAFTKPSNVNYCERPGQGLPNPAITRWKIQNCAKIISLTFKQCQTEPYT